MVEVSGGWRSRGDSWLAGSPSDGGGIGFLLAGRVIDRTPTHLGAHAQLSQVTRSRPHRGGTTRRAPYVDSGMVSVSILLQRNTCRNCEHRRSSTARGPLLICPLIMHSSRYVRLRSFTDKYRI